MELHKRWQDVRECADDHSDHLGGRTRAGEEIHRWIPGRRRSHLFWIELAYCDQLGMGTALLDDSGDLETCGFGYLEFLDTWKFGGSIPTLTESSIKEIKHFIVKSPSD